MEAPALAARPRVGIVGLTGCAGDQLALLDCEDELLAIVERVDVRDFLMASSANDDTGRLDLVLVEGAVVSRRDEEALLRIRERSRLVVALGTCAVWGGVAAMDRLADRGALAREIYGDAAEGYDSLPARSIGEVVDVDFALTGCPIEKHELLSALACLLRGDPPLVAQYPVCAECRARETVCLLLRDGAVCLGALTAGGCRARCPALGVPCVGCRGPSRDANVPAALAIFEERGIPRQELERKLATFAPLPAPGLDGGRGGAP